MSLLFNDPNANQPASLAALFASNNMLATPKTPSRAASGGNGPAPLLGKAAGAPPVAPTDDLQAAILRRLTDPATAPENNWLTSPNPDLARVFNQPPTPETMPAGTLGPPAMLTASPVDMLLNSARAAANKPNAYSLQDLQDRANDARVRGVQDFLNAHVVTPPTPALLEPPTLPTRPTEPIPVRGPDPSVPLLPGIAALLGGLFVPRAAAQLTASPLEAARQYADEAFANARTGYAMKQAQDQADTEAAMNAARMKQQADEYNARLTNASNQEQYRAALGQNATLADLAGDRAANALLTDPTTGLPALSAQDTAATAAAAQGDVLQTLVQHLQEREAQGDKEATQRLGALEKWLGTEQMMQLRREAATRTAANQAASLAARLAHNHATEAATAAGRASAEKRAEAALLERETHNHVSEQQNARKIQNKQDSDTGRVPINLPVPGRAGGGPVEAGQPTLVGEKGPEVIVTTAPATVLSNEMLVQAMKLLDGMSAQEKKALRRAHPPTPEPIKPPVMSPRMAANRAAIQAARVIGNKPH